jgi:demethylmenaquinone methyltransferase/2-methoxy-6-polyprenyl-1,4-benzoquinol methylase
MPSSLDQHQQIDMAHQPGAGRSQQVQAMFSRIARRYDLMNRLMTAGQDVRWRREVIQRTHLPANGRVLDIGAGTGDLAREVLLQKPGSWPVAADFTLEMMRVGKAHHDSTALDWSAADALCLPFPDEAFDAVVSGFLLRNVINIKDCLREQHRVLKAGGFAVALDTTQPPKNFLRPLIDFHLHVIIPNLGRLITGEAEAYTYLPETTEKFLQAEKLAEIMEQVGFTQVGFQRLMFSTVAIHWGLKT